MAVDVSRIPNNNKFDPVREAILDLQTQLESEGQTAYDGEITINTSGNLTGDGTFTVNQSGNTTITIGIDDSDYLSLSDTGEQTIAGDIVISGDLTVSGSTITKLSEEVLIEDAVIVLNSNEDGTPTENAGIEIERGTSTNKTFLWNETSDKWTLGSETLIAGTFEGNLTGNADTATSLAASVNIEIDGAVIGNADFDGSSDIIITTSVNHNHDADYVNVSGDTMTGDLELEATAPTTNDTSNATPNLTFTAKAKQSDGTAVTDSVNVYADYYSIANRFTRLYIDDNVNIQGTLLMNNDILVPSGVNIDIGSNSNRINHIYTNNLTIGTTLTAPNLNVSGSYKMDNTDIINSNRDFEGRFVTSEAPLGAVINLKRDDDSIVADDDLGQLVFYGQDTGGTYQSAGRIKMIADDTWDATFNQESRLEFWTHNTTTEVKRLVIGTETFDIRNSGLSIAGTERIEIDGDATLKNVTAASFIGDGSQLTNLPAGSLDLQDVTTNGATTTNSITVGGLTSNGGVTVNGRITLPQNPVGTTYGNGVSTVPSYMFQQTAGDNDGIRMYAEAGVTNDVRFIFEVVDDLETGDTWVFRNKLTYGAYTANEVVKISGAGDITNSGGITSNGILDVTSSSVASALLITSDGGNEQVRIRRYSNNNEQLLLGFHSSDYAQIQAVEQGVAYRPLALNPNGGFVGIGKTNPDYVFQAVDNGHTFSVNPHVAGVDLHSTGNFAPHYQTNFDWFTGAIGSGSHKMRLTSGGSLGIGTTSPSQKLQVAGIGEFAGAIRITETGTAQNILIGNQDSGGTNKPSRIMGVNGALRFGWGDSWSGEGGTFTEAFQSKSNGDVYFNNSVGIGTTTPDTHLDVSSGVHTKLRVQTTGVADASVEILGYDAGVHIGDPTNGNRWAIWNDGVSTTSKLGFGSYALGGWYTDGAQVMTLTHDGNVGIGTTSPSGKLTINGGSYIDNIDGPNDLVIESTSTVGGGIRLTNNTNKNWFIYHGGASSWVGDGGLGFVYSDGVNAASGPKVTFLPSGNVGIGTTTPAQKLHVVGDIRMGTSGVGSILRINRPSDGADAGNVGFFSSSANSDFGLRNGSGGGDIRLYSNDGSLRFYTGSSFTNQVFRITNTGAVGVGTTSPSEKLHVSGNIRQTGYQRSDNYQSQGDYGWHWHGVRYNTYLGDTRSKLYEYFYNNTAAPAAETYVDTYNLNSNAYMGENIWGNVHQYHAMFKTYIYVKRTFTVTNAQLNGDDPYAIWIDGTYVAGRDSCCTATPYTYTFTVGWHKIELIYSEGGGGHYVQMGWNPKDYTAYIAAMNPHGPVDLYNLGGFSYRDGKLGIGVKDPAYAIDATGTIRASSDIIAFSDARVKENVKTIDNALDKVTKLRGVEYNKIGEDEQKIGVIAQEIEQILPQVVAEDENGMKSVAYGNIVGVLIEAIKDQQKQIDELKARLDGSTN